MATTQTLRRWSPELVKSGVDANWNVVGPLSCDWQITEKVSFYAGGPYSGSIDLRFHPAVKEAFRALATVFRAFGYSFDESAGGSVSCRKITNGSRTSPHAHGICLDINPSRNRYRYSVGPIQWGRQTDMPEPMVKAALAIRTKAGKQVFDWGGLWVNIKDPMHWEIDLSPQDLAVGVDWSTVRGTPVDDVEETMFVRKGDENDKVRAMQLLLIKRGYPLPTWGPDGDFGNETASALANFQRDQAITDEPDYYGPRSYAALTVMPGPKGDKGEPGEDGKDSTVPGPRGAPGQDGEDGADGRPGPSPTSVTLQVSGAEFKYE